ncbi:transcriptional regulator, TetR family [Algoriphagus faecimaris]|uniref:Transcriptional regulator, TetR family n=1 Tax=Algoriphagus faecimaris TaxID=686796 RepID=A0A1G6N971_9BACT|nr:TetR/AcrR family transcriptional regulator [Algoriphagus faecimaris]SDC64389.1 transcriptional regulator, TetR family [Algoriphagus faecimaris]
MDTKIKILTAARLLFNDLGFSNVTIRMIASELQMSSGNLNYHFKTRDDILEALYFEMVQEFDKRVEQLGIQEISFQSIKRDMHLSMKRMVDYRFFWTDLYNLLRLNQSIKAHFEAVYLKRFEGYEFLMRYLTDKGLLREFEFSTERKFLIERMIGFSNTWLYNSSIYEIEINDKYLDHQTGNLLAMLYPYLTNLGKLEFKKVRSDYFY